MGDQLLAIDEHSVQGMPLSHATSLLHNLGDLVDLKILRSHDISNASASSGMGLPQTQAIYAKVQRRPRSPSANTEASGSNNNNNNGTAKDQQQQQRIFHVTLYKDKVYDDYGFSVSDGLYERGVFINRIRSGGPADMCGQLKPFDRIMQASQSISDLNSCYDSNPPLLASQVNEMKTQDFDCCLTVPLIAAAGDKIEMIMQRTE